MKNLATAVVAMTLGTAFPACAMTWEICITRLGEAIAADGAGPIGQLILLADDIARDESVPPDQREMVRQGLKSVDDRVSDLGNLVADYCENLRN